MESKTDFMVVKIRFGRGPVVSRRTGKNRHLALLAASMLTLGSISFTALGLWRLGTDLDWAGEFVVEQGLLSHWQVWIGAAVGVQYAAWRLTRYSKAVGVTNETTVVEESPAESRAAANV